MTEGMETTTSEPSKGERSGCRQTGCAGCLFFTLCLFLVLGFIAALSDMRGDLTAPITGLVFLLPTLAGSGLALVRWSSSHAPLTVLKWLLLAAVPVIPIAAIAQFSRPMGESVLIALAALVFVMFAWFPQVALVLLFFHLRRPGGVVLTRRFSLRTFFVGFTLLSIALAGLGLYVKSSYGMQYYIERITRFHLNNWHVAPSASVDDMGRIRQQLSQVLADRIASSLEAQGFRQVTVPPRLANRHVYVASDLREFEDDLEKLCFVRDTARNQQVYVLIVSHEGELLKVETGTVQMGWQGRAPVPALAVTQEAHSRVIQFLDQLEAIVDAHRSNTDPVAAIEAETEKRAIPPPSGPQQE